MIAIMRVAEADLAIKVQDLTDKLAATFMSMTPEELEELPVAELFTNIRLHEIAMPRRQFLKRRRGGEGAVVLSVESTDDAPLARPSIRTAINRVKSID